MKSQRHNGSEVLSRFLLIILCCSLCAATSKPKSAAKRKVPDYVALPVVAQKLDLTFDEDALMDTLHFSGSDYQQALSAIVTSQAGCLLKQQALIIHFGHWYAFGAKGPFTLYSSNWYVYHASSKSAKLVAANMKAASGGQPVQRVAQCDLQQAGLKADDTARLYGDNSAVLLAIDILTPRDGPTSSATAIANNLPLTYKVSVTPVTPANVQNLGMLLGALLNVTIPGAAPQAPGATPTPPPPVPVTYVAASRIGGLEHLPFTFNIAFSFSLPKDQSGGPANNQGGTVAPPAPAANPAPQAVPPVDSNPTSANTVTSPPPVAPMAPNLPLPDGTGRVGGNNQGNPGATQNQGGQNQGGQNQGGQKSTDGTSKQAGTTVIDCSATNDQTPCSFSHSFQSDDKEWWDISIGVTVPGVQEAKYSKGASAPPSTTRHTDLYAILDLLPFAKWYGKDAFAPRLNVGLPVTGQTFYRPYFGMSENLTGRWRSFPLQLNAFAGVVYMKQSIVLPGSSPAVLKQDRALKGLFGVEVPISSIVSKLKGGSKSGGTGKSGSSSSQ